MLMSKHAELQEQIRISRNRIAAESTRLAAMQAQLTKLEEASYQGGDLPGSLLQSAHSRNGAQTSESEKRAGASKVVISDGFAKYMENCCQHNHGEEMLARRMAQQKMDEDLHSRPLEGLTDTAALLEQAEGHSGYQRHWVPTEGLEEERDQPSSQQPRMPRNDFGEDGPAMLTDLGSWMGSVSPQVEASESYVIGQGCNHLPGVHRLGGPSGLSNNLANKVMMYSSAGYIGHKLRDMVANSFATDLPGTGPWNVATGSIDWNLYHDQGDTCTIAVKLPDWGADWIVYGS